MQRARGRGGGVVHMNVSISLYLKKISYNCTFKFVTVKTGSQKYRQTDAHMN
jgi:hypothetical protein